MVRETVLFDGIWVSQNVMNILCGQQDDYFTVTMEKGEIFLRGNLLAAPASQNTKMFPVNHFFPFPSHLLSFNFTPWPTFYYTDLVLFFRHHSQADDWVDILIICRDTGISVREKSTEIATAQVKYKTDQFQEFYIGGAPQELRERCWVLTFSHLKEK